MTETFRLRKMMKYMGMAFTAIFLAAAFVYLSIFFLEEPARHGFQRENSVVIVGSMGLIVFGAMLFLSVYVWAAYYVERFTVDGTKLALRSMLQNRQFEVSEIKGVLWRRYPNGGTILFHLPDGKARLDLDGYSKDDRIRIIRALHDLVPAQVQEGWPMFCHAVALPLRDGKPAIVRADPSAKLTTITRRRYDRMLMVGLPLSIAVAIAFWAGLNLGQFFALPVLVFGAWLLLRFNVPREGSNEVQLLDSARGRASTLR